jgi:hypothetical protein
LEAKPGTENEVAKRLKRPPFWNEVYLKST